MEILNELTNKAKILVLFANAYDMPAERGGNVTGCSVHYLYWGAHGEALASRSEFNPTKPVGLQRAKCSMDIKMRENIVVAPGIYEGTFVTTVGGDGKSVQKLVDIAFLSHVEFTAKIIPGFVCPGQIPEAEAREMLGLNTDKPADNKVTK